MRETQDHRAGAPQLADSFVDDAHSPRLAACLLLAGGLKLSALTAATGVSPLDLHLTSQGTVFDAWLDQFDRLSAGEDRPVDVRVIHGSATPPPTHPRFTPPSLRLRIESDSSQYRGPAGIARDVCSEYAADATILIAEAARFVVADLASVLAHHHTRAADITVVCNADSSPAGIFLAKRSTLDLVPRIGFMDLKEQWLTRAVTSGLHVRVHRLSGCPSYELRTPAQFIVAARVARAAARSAKDDAPQQSPDISPGAVVVDSVVMPGAVIPERCVVVRSIVCAGARVEPGATVIDQVIRREIRRGRRAPGRLADRE